MIAIDALGDEKACVVATVDAVGIHGARGVGAYPDDIAAAGVVGGTVGGSLGSVVDRGALPLGHVVAACGRRKCGDQSE